MDLTDKERATLDEAMAILQAHTPADRASWIVSVHHKHCDVTYFDSSDTTVGARQHSSLWFKGCTFADKVQMAISIEANLIASADERRAARVVQLRDELAKLEQAA